MANYCSFCYRNKNTEPHTTDCPDWRYKEFEKDKKMNDNLKQLLLDLYEFLDNFSDSWAFGGEIAERSQRFQEKLSKAMNEMEDDKA